MHLHIRTPFFAPALAVAAGEAALRGATEAT